MFDNNLSNIEQLDNKQQQTPAQIVIQNHQLLEISIKIHEMFMDASQLLSNVDQIR